MKLLTYQADKGRRVAILTEDAVEEIAPRTGDVYGVIDAGVVPGTRGKPMPHASVKLLHGLIRSSSNMYPFDNLDVILAVAGK